MAAKISAAVERAISRVTAGESASSAARAESCDVSSVRRALRRAGVPALPRRGSGTPAAAPGATRCPTCGHVTAARRG